MSLKLGIDDPEKWLAEMDDETYANWYAYYRCEPFGDEQYLLARAVSLLMIIAMQNLEPEKVSKASDSIVEQLMPPNWVNAKEQSEKVGSIESFEKFAAMVFG